MDITLDRTRQSVTHLGARSAAGRTLALHLAALARGPRRWRRERDVRLERAAMISHEARDLGIDTGIARFAASGGLIQR